MPRNVPIAGLQRLTDTPGLLPGVQVNGIGDEPAGVWGISNAGGSFRLVSLEDGSGEGSLRYLSSDAPLTAPSPCYSFDSVHDGMFVEPRDVYAVKADPSEAESLALGGALGNRQHASGRDRGVRTSAGAPKHAEARADR